MNQKNSICLIIVNYNSDNFALELIKSIKPNTFKQNLKIIIVDNSERKDSTEFFNKIKHSNAVCIKAPKNLGYFGGARHGFNEYKKLSNNIPEYLIVCNSDVYFKSTEIFEKLINYNYKSDIGVIAPSIISTQLNADKNPKIINRPTSKTMHFYKVLFRSRIFQNIYIILHFIKYKLLNLLKKYVSKQNNRNSKSMKNIYAPHGSFIIFTKFYFLNGGNLKYPCFLFNEEVFVAETVLKLNLKVIYDNQLIVYDNEHVSTGIFRSKIIANYVAISSKYVAEEYF
ncbi:MAG: hypothetical protein CMG62_10005 [Candidatus Marinimicrobia bacterium]|nr:hypothetical protein [Candidatus Neomarinimicrobiota bacterium]